MFPNFKTEDITHHSKRTQAGNIEKAGTSYDVVSANQNGVSVNSGSVCSYLNVPKSVTLESAIKFFRENSVGECATLFKMTAEWLDKYRVASRTAMNKLIQEAKENEEKDSDTVTVDMSEVGE